MSHATDGASRTQFWALYLTRFAEGFGFITLLTLLPTYINTLDPQATTVLGVTVSAGFIIGMYTTGFTLAQTVAVIPLAWAGDRFDKRLVLLAVLGAGAGVYALFPLVDSSATFVVVRAFQGLVVTGAGLMTLSLVGQIAAAGTRADKIGKANAASFAASILGSLGAGAVYDAVGFGPVFALITALMIAAWLVTWGFLDDDPTRVEGFPFSDLAVNRKILTISTFRAQYAFAVTMVRTWVPIYAGTELAAGGLAVGATAVAVTVTAEKATNMVGQLFTGRLSDAYGRSLFVFAGGGAYGAIAMAIPFSAAIGAALGTGVTVPILGQLPAAYLPLVALSGLLGAADSFREPASMALFADEGTDDGGVASSFGIRELVWRPGSVAGPLIAGWLMVEVSMASVFYVGGAFAVTGVLAFLAVLAHDHGRAALTAW
ncbi:Predicted arabinose efflux permease, MFS family [Halorubrum xinjiangense]|uniref:Predicted arabinose efflux permease, MFS family n=1 Tax=Halorubrum xinjiangense TaxID=261291 RepID=A0A1G7JN33_9EURY|nr:MFS transporter [Halorubrum xinjiangense]SDF25869.1 Predicted arabinose efflux permease, MFS family [Halorubrum xinjiangense]